MTLDPGEYKGTYKLIGGEVCFDFTNTVSWRETDHPHEWLDSFENLSRWAKITGVLETKDANKLLQTLKNSEKEGKTKLAQLRKTREFLFGLFSCLAHQGPIPGDDLQKLSTLAQKARNHQVLISSPSGYQWSWASDISPMDQLLYSIIQSASEVITQGDLTRIKQCPSCQWLYMDLSKNKSRRWCTMEDCGNRHKVNAFNRNKKKQQKKAK